MTQYVTLRPYTYLKNTNPSQGKHTDTIFKTPKAATDLDPVVIVSVRSFHTLCGLECGSPTRGLTSLPGFPYLDCSYRPTYFFHTWKVRKILVSGSISFLSCQTTASPLASYCIREQSRHTPVPPCLHTGSKFL